MQPHQVRVVDEKVELFAKLDKLRAFTFSDTFKALSEKERNLLLKQAGTMQQYLDILSERISGF